MKNGALLKIAYNLATNLAKKQNISADELTDEQWDQISLEAELMSKEQDIVASANENEHSDPRYKKRKIMEWNSIQLLQAKANTIQRIQEESSNLTEQSNYNDATIEESNIMESSFKGIKTGDSEEESISYSPSENVETIPRSYDFRSGIGFIETALCDYETYLDPNVSVEVSTTSTGEMGIDHNLTKENAELVNIIGRAKVPYGNGHQMRHVVPIAFIEKKIKDSIEQAKLNEHNNINDFSEDLDESSEGSEGSESKHIEDYNSIRSNAGERIFKLVSACIDDFVQVDDFGRVLKPKDLKHINTAQVRKKYNERLNKETSLLKKNIMNILDGSNSQKIILTADEMAKLKYEAKEIRAGQFRLLPKLEKQGVVDKIADDIIEKRGILIAEEVDICTIRDLNIVTEEENRKRLEIWNEIKRKSIKQSIYNKVMPYLKNNSIVGAQHIANLLLAEFNKHSTAAFPTEGNSQNEEARIGVGIRGGNKVNYRIVRNQEELDKAREELVLENNIEEGLIKNEGARINFIVNELNNITDMDNSAEKIAELLYEAFDYKKLEDEIWGIENKKLVSKEGPEIRKLDIKKVQDSRKYTKNVKFRGEVQTGEYDEYLPVAMKRYLKASFATFPHIERVDVIDEFIKQAQQNYNLNEEQKPKLSNFFLIMRDEIENEQKSASMSSSISKETPPPRSDEEDPNSDLSLRRNEKRILGNHTKAHRLKFIDLFYKDASNANKELLNEFRAQQKEKDLTIKESTQESSCSPEITLIPENDHSINHKNNCSKLMKMIKSNEIESNTVICIERKEQGENFGMKDVRLLAQILEYNSINADKEIPIPNQIKNSPIYYDALLYNIAKQHGIEVVGIEGKNLEYSKESPEYNSMREAYMATQINQIIASGKNVIFPVGSAHVKGLASRLGSKSVLLLTDNSKVNNEIIVPVPKNHYQIQPVTPLKINKKNNFAYSK